MESKTLQQLADHVGGQVQGDGSVTIESVSTLDSARPGQITFLSNKKYESQLEATTASAVIVGCGDENIKVPRLIADDPYYAFQQIVVLLHGHRKHPPVGISKNANIAKTAKLGQGSQVSDYVTISDNAVIGKNCYFYPRR